MPRGPTLWRMTVVAAGFCVGALLWLAWSDMSTAPTFESPWGPMTVDLPAHQSPLPSDAK